MTIVYSTDLVDIVDCASAFNIKPWYRLRHNDFTLEKPFFRSKATLHNATDTTTDDTHGADSLLEKLSPAAASIISPKKKRRINSSNTDKQTQERHDHLLPFLLTCMDQAAPYWQQQQQQQQQQEEEEEGEDQRRHAKTVSKMDLIREQQKTMAQISDVTIDDRKGQQELDKTDESTLVQFPDWIPMATASRRFQQITNTPTISLDKEQQEFELLEVFGQKVKNESSDCRTIKLSDNETFIIPPRSGFLMGDLETIDDLLLTDNEMVASDLIVMDPPWPNKSVHRSSHYETQDIYDLYQIPITDMVCEHSLIAVWVTNKPKYRRFVIDKLFKSWHVTCVAEWTWLKVTNDGEPVFPLSSTHRKPYEQLIIGRYHGSENNSLDEQNVVKPIPYQHSIISVPSKRHSRKPPLQEILKPYLPTEPKCLELFARCLTPGCFSWGNECLKYQNEYYYTRIESPP